MPLSSLNQWGIKKRVALLILAPLTLITIFSTTYSIYLTTVETRTNLLHSGSEAVRYIAALAEFGMFAGNIQDLDTLAKAALNGQDVEAIAFLNLEKKILSLNQKDSTTLSINPETVEATKPSRDGRFLYFNAPIKLAGIEFRDFAEPLESPAAEQVIGWVVLVLNEKNQLERQQSIIITSLTLMGGAALFSGLLAWLLASGITRSLINITHAVQKLTKGDYQARVPENSGGELGELEQGINELAYQGGKAQLLMEQNIAKATQKLRDTMAKLEKHITELELAKNRAEVANQAKDQFLARMSHELRTPLTTVLGFSKLLKKTEQNKEQAEHTGIIMHASTLLLSIIDDILEFSRIQSSTISLESIDFDLESCLDEVIALHSFSAHEKELELVLLIESDVPLQLRGDKLRLQQMISNLVSNSIKFTSHGNIVVLVSVIEELDDDVTLQLLVLDTGEGISPNNLAKLFKPFAQADTSISRRHGGTGLGLVIVKSFAELMHGSIKIDSQIGMGTEIILSIRFKKQSNKSLTTTTLTSLTLDTIIVYEQNAWIRRSFRSRLLSFTPHLFMATQQLSFLDLLRQHAENCHLAIIGFTAQELNSDELESFLLNVRKRFSGTLMLVAGCSNMAEIFSDSLQQKLQPVILLSKPVAGRNLYAAVEDCVGQKFNSGATVANEATHKLPVETGGALCGLDILVAEDNELNLRLIRIVLEAAGAKTWPAQNGIKAIDACAAKTFNLILMDVHMPLIDGIEASRQIRRNNPTNSHTPIIALTADVMDSEVRALENVGIASICYKPIDEAVLIKNILQAVSDGENPSLAKDEPAIAIKKEILYAEVRRQISEIEAALPKSDWISIKNLSHQLKGLTGLTRLQNIPQITRDLDHAAKQENRDLVNTQLVLLKTIIC